MGFSQRRRILILSTLSLLALILVSCGLRREPVTPGRLVGFSPDGYSNTKVEVVLDGKIDSFEASDVVVLNMEFRRDNSLVRMSVAQFEGRVGATSFWYSWSREVAGPVRSSFSAFPFIYGELSGRFNEEEYVNAWFSGRWVYVFRGEKAYSDELAELFKEYKRAVERAVGL